MSLAGHIRDDSFASRRGCDDCGDRKVRATAVDTSRGPAVLCLGCIAHVRGEGVTVTYHGGHSVRAGRTGAVHTWSRGLG